MRNILGDEDLTRELCEVMEWSPEAIGSVDFLSRDPFQQLGGETASWFIAPTKDGSEDGAAVHPDVLAIGTALRDRLSRREPVLGGDRLQSTYRNALWLGDGYSELEICRDGLGGYGISRLVDHPSLMVFHCIEDGEISAYELKGQSDYWHIGADQEEPVLVPWWKMLHLSHRGRQGRYGVPLFQAQIDSAWRPLKATAEDMLDIIRASGTAPWVHTYGKDATPEQKDVYKRTVLEERETRFIADLFIGHGGSVTRASSSENALSGVLAAKESYRAAMVPPGVPSWLFPGLDAGASTRDIAQQPMLNHARVIADARSKIGAQIKWAITLEIVLKKDYDFYMQEGQFEISWPKWFVTGMESEIMSGGSTRPQDSAASQRINRMMGDLEKRQTSLLKLSNVGRVIEEVEANG